ncbi:hypothetical protein DPMN_053005 [Dreissena polymorpha]|uniref:Uncharacterized protein n=1 Tax=Dreissena polymorpha TaxID=45954 RepID=A0A9D4CLX0_DREPO|nr:hypothetical protein DPMN_053005 [Dreissena polymorpha]
MGLMSYAESGQELRCPLKVMQGFVVSYPDRAASDQTGRIWHLTNFSIMLVQSSLTVHFSISFRESKDH